MTGKELQPKGQTGKPSFHADGKRDGIPSEIRGSSNSQIAMGMDYRGEPIQISLEPGETPEEIVRRNPGIYYFSISEITEFAITVDTGSIKDRKTVMVKSDPQPITGTFYVNGVVGEARYCSDETLKKLGISRDSNKNKGINLVCIRGVSYFIFNEDDKVIDTKKEEKEAKRSLYELFERRRISIPYIEVEHEFAKEIGGKSGSETIDQWLAGLEEMTREDFSGAYEQVKERSSQALGGLNTLSVRDQQSLAKHDSLVLELKQLVAQGEEINGKNDNRLLKEHLPKAVRRVLLDLNLLAKRTDVNPNTDGEGYHNPEAEERIDEISQAIKAGNMEVLYFVLEQFRYMASGEKARIERVDWSERSYLGIFKQRVFPNSSLSGLRKTRDSNAPAEQKANGDTELRGAIHTIAKRLVALEERHEICSYDEAIFGMLMEVFEKKGLVREEVVKADYWNKENGMISWNGILEATKTAPKLSA